MANYFVINNKFKPYSFDELIKPYQIYGQTYREQEAAIDAAREKEFSADYLNAEQDKEAYDMYSAAQQGLQSVSDELATKGLSASLRNRLRSTARDYRKTMDTLNTAQAQLNAERSRRANLGDDYVFKQEDIRIGDFLNGNTPNQEGVKLSKITKSISDKFAPLASNISKDTWGKVLSQNGKVINGYFDVTTKLGLEQAQLNTILSMANDEEWNNYIMSDPTITPDQKRQLEGFVNAIKTEMTAIDYAGYQEDERKEIWGAIVEGAHTGLGATKHSYQRDIDYNPSFDFQKKQYSDNQGFKKQQLEAKYPYWDFENNKIKSGWKQDKSGRWISPEGQIFSSSGRGSIARKPYTGVMWYKDDGTLKAEYTDTGHATTPQHTYALNGTEVLRSATASVEVGSGKTKETKTMKTLSDQNIRILANAIGEPIAETEEIPNSLADSILRRAKDIGMEVRVFGTERNKKTGEIVKQQLITVDRKSTTYGGTSSDEDVDSLYGDIEFNPDAIPVGEE